MGAVFWLVSALSIFLVARIVPAGRIKNYLLELIASLAAAFACGLAATALDFGRCRQSVWRAVLFALPGTASALAPSRAVQLPRN